MMSSGLYNSVILIESTFCFVFSKGKVTYYELYADGWGGLELDVDKWGLVFALCITQSSGGKDQMGSYSRMKRLW